MLKLLEPPLAPPLVVGIAEEEPVSRSLARSDAALAASSFDAFYRSTWRFVWRSLGRLGAPAAAMPDLFQEVYLVVHRRLPEYEAPAENHDVAERVWLMQIIRFVLRSHRRREHRKYTTFESEPADLETLPAPSETPFGIAERSERVRVLYELLDTLDEEKREIFVLVELEGLTVRDAALALKRNEHTARTCLNAARAAFRKSFDRYRARDEWRLK